MNPNHNLITNQSPALTWLKLLLNDVHERNQRSTHWFNIVSSSLDWRFFFLCHATVISQYFLTKVKIGWSWSAIGYNGAAMPNAARCVTANAAGWWHTLISYYSYFFFFFLSFFFFFLLFYSEEILWKWAEVEILPEECCCRRKLRHFSSMVSSFSYSDVFYPFSFCLSVFCFFSKLNFVNYFFFNFFFLVRRSVARSSFSIRFSQLLFDICRHDASFLHWKRSSLVSMHLVVSV